MTTANAQPRQSLTDHDWKGYPIPPKAVVDATEDLVVAEIQYQYNKITTEELHGRRREWRGIVANCDDSAKELNAVAEHVQIVARRTDERVADIEAALLVLHITLSGLVGRVADQVSKPEESDRVRAMMIDFLNGFAEQRNACNKALTILRRSNKELSDRACQSIGGDS